MKVFVKFNEIEKLCQAKAQEENFISKKTQKPSARLYAIKTNLITKKTWDHSKTAQLRGGDKRVAVDLFELENRYKKEISSLDEISNEYSSPIKEAMYGHSILNILKNSYGRRISYDEYISICKKYDLNPNYLKTCMTHSKYIQYNKANYFILDNTPKPLSKEFIDRNTEKLLDMCQKRAAIALRNKNSELKNDLVNELWIIMSNYGGSVEQSNIETTDESIISRLSLYLKVCIPSALKNVLPDYRQVDLAHYKGETIPEDKIKEFSSDILVEDEAEGFSYDESKLLLKKLETQTIDEIISDLIIAYPEFAKKINDDLNEINKISDETINNEVKNKDIR